jgi:hypothetical protein
MDFGRLKGLLNHQVKPLLDGMKPLKILAEISWSRTCDSAFPFFSELIMCLGEQHAIRPFALNLIDEQFDTNMCQSTHILTLRHSSCGEIAEFTGLLYVKFSIKRVVNHWCPLFLVAHIPSRFLRQTYQPAAPAFFFQHAREGRDVWDPSSSPILSAFLSSRGASSPGARAICLCHMQKVNIKLVILEI